MQKYQGEKLPRRKFSTIIAVLVCLLLIPILIVNLTIIVKSFTNPEKVPGFLGYKPMIVLSGSMEPMILPGDIVVVKEANADSLQEGDIISYLSGKSVVTHRIMEIDAAEGDRKFYTKGDNNNANDGIVVTDDMLEGKFLFNIPRLGHVAMFMQKPAGIVLFIAVPLMLFILYDIFRRRYYDKKEIVMTKKLEEELETMKKKLAEAEARDQKSPDDGPDAKTLGEETLADQED